jgi:hypothetical protein
MRPLGSTGACFLIGIFLLSTVPADAQIHEGDRMPLALRSRVCQPSEQTTCGANMQVVEAALKSPAALWKFITSPNAGYFERIVGASRAGKLIPASWIPKVLAAQNELAKEASLHEFGIQRYPLNEAGRYWQKTPRDRMGTQVKRNILGHAFLVPEKWIDYPLTDEEIKRSPWPFQVRTALGVLHAAIFRNGDAREIDAFALKLPCTDFDSAEVLVRLTTEVAEQQHYASQAVWGAWFNILRNPKTDRANEFVHILDQVSADTECLQKTAPTFCPKAEVLALEALKKHDDSVIHEILGFHSYPVTLVLASARFVLSPEFRKYYSAQDQANDANWLRYITSPTRARDPFPHNLAPDDAANQRAVKSFADAFEQEGREMFLENYSREDRPFIEKTYKKLSTATACRP